MNPTRRVLVPIDFSSASQAAVKYALKEFNYNLEQLILLHAYRLISDSHSGHQDSPIVLRKTLETKLRKAYEGFSEKIIGEGRVETIDFRIQVGFLAKCIQSICQESQIDLILLTIKSKKQHHVLKELIALSCAPIQLVSERINTQSNLPLISKNITAQTLRTNWDQYIHDLENNPSLSYTVLPE